MVNEILVSPTLTVMDLPCPSSRLPYDFGSAYKQHVPRIRARSY